MYNYITENLENKILPTVALFYLACLVYFLSEYLYASVS